jgi:hypothetical protein
MVLIISPDLYHKIYLRPMTALVLEGCQGFKRFDLYATRRIFNVISPSFVELEAQRWPLIIITQR